MILEIDNRNLSDKAKKMSPIELCSYICDGWNSSIKGYATFGFWTGKPINENILIKARELEKRSINNIGGRGFERFVDSTQEIKKLFDDNDITYKVI